MDVVVRMLSREEQSVLERVAPNVFDHPIDLRWSAEFFADPRHHLAVALEKEVVVGMASGFHYIHPDKPPELWVNEVGVAPAYQNHGIGRRLLAALFARGHELGCTGAWVLTEETNKAARRLYQVVGGEEKSCVMYSFRLTNSNA